MKFLWDFCSSFKVSSMKRIEKTKEKKIREARVSSRGS